MSNVWQCFFVDRDDASDNALTAVSYNDFDATSTCYYFVNATMYPNVKCMAKPSLQFRHTRISYKELHGYNGPTSTR